MHPQPGRRQLTARPAAQPLLIGSIREDRPGNLLRNGSSELRGIY